MSNLILMCHGDIREFSSFELGKGQTIQYRGNFGAVLGVDVAKRVITILFQDPTVSDKELQRAILNYTPSAPMEGPGGFKPDIDLTGDDVLPTCLIDLNTRRFIRLDSSFAMTLNAFIHALPAEFYLDLLCCTDIGMGLMPPKLEDYGRVDDLPALLA